LISFLKFIFGKLILTLSVNQFQSITVQLFCKNQITA